jgi:hypothetical protein
MTKEQILIELKKLSLEDKFSVLATLSRIAGLEEKDNQLDILVNHHIDLMKQLSGDDFLTGRTRKNSQARMVVARCLQEAGLNLSHVGRILGYDHSTISHYNKLWEDALSLPVAYKDVLKLYTTYKSML